MKLRKWARLDRRMEQRLHQVVELACRRDSLLESPALDLEGLRVLVDDYEAANLPSAAADLRKRLEYYREKKSLTEL